MLADSAVGGFEVHTLINQPSHKVSLEIESFFDNRKRDDLLVLYFSGHGLKYADGQLYFATIDTQLVQHSVRRATAVSAHFVNEVMSRSRSRRQILVLDCCYSGAFKEGLLAKGDRRAGAGDQLNGQGRVVLTASDALQYSFEGEKAENANARSIFTNALVHGLETGEADLDRDGLFSLDEVYDYVHARVSQEQPEQRPTKMGYVEGRLFLGTNPRPVASDLPSELRESLDDRRPWVRAGVVSELELLLDSPNKGVAMAARGALSSLAASDDSQQVRAAAGRALAGDKAIAEPLREPSAPPADPGTSAGTAKPGAAVEEPEHPIPSASPPREQPPSVPGEALVGSVSQPLSAAPDEIIAGIEPPAASSPSTPGFQLSAGQAPTIALGAAAGLVVLAMVVWLIHRQTVPQTPANTGDQNAAGSSQIAAVIHFEPRPPLEGHHDEEVCDVAFSPVSDVLASADCGWQVHNAAINLWAVPGRRLCSRRVAAGRQSNRVQRRRKASGRRRRPAQQRQVRNRPV